MENQYNVSLSQKLSKTGLSDKEAEIYAYLIEHGGAFPSAISKATGINRTTVYKILDTLSIRGLITELEKRKKLFYQAENPKSLDRFTDSQITIAKRAKESLEQVMPILEGLYRSSPNKPIVRFFEGKEGVFAIYRDHIATNKKYEMLAFSNTSEIVQFLSEDFKKEYLKIKARVGITTRVITPDDEVDIKYNEIVYKNFPKILQPKLKHISKKIFPFKGEITIYQENKVSIVNFNEPNVAGTIIEDQIIHDMMKMIFELSWKGLK